MKNWKCVLEKSLNFWSKKGYELGHISNKFHTSLRLGNTVNKWAKHVTFSFECQHFGVAEPQFTAAAELKVDISHHEAMWGLYEEFSNGLDELAKEDWISFRYSVLCQTVIV